MLVLFWVIPYLLTILLAIKGINKHTDTNKKVYLLYAIPCLFLSIWSFFLLVGIVPL